MFCEKCGCQLLPGARFCSGCGAAVRAADVGVETAALAPCTGCDACDPMHLACPDCQTAVADPVSTVAPAAPAASLQVPVAYDAVPFDATVPFGVPVMLDGTVPVAAHELGDCTGCDVCDPMHLACPDCQTAAAVTATTPVAEPVVALCPNCLVTHLTQVDPALV